MKLWLSIAVLAVSAAASPVGTVLFVEDNSSTTVLELDSSLAWRQRTAIPRKFTFVAATGELVVGTNGLTGNTEVWKYDRSGAARLAYSHPERFEALTAFSPTEILAYSPTRGLKLLSATGERGFCSAASLRRPLSNVTLVHRGSNEVLLVGSAPPVSGAPSYPYVFERIWLTALNNCSLAYAESLPYFSPDVAPVLVGDEAIYVMDNVQSGRHRLSHADLLNRGYVGNSLLVTATANTSWLEPLAFDAAPPSGATAPPVRFAHYRVEDDLLALALDGSPAKVLAPGLFSEATLRSAVGSPTGKLAITHRMAPSLVGGFGPPASPPPEKPSAPAVPTVESRFTALWAEGYRKGLVPQNEPPDPLTARALVALVEGQPMQSEWLHFALREAASRTSTALGVEWRGVNWGASSGDKTFRLPELVDLLKATKSCKEYLSAGP